MNRSLLPVLAIGLWACHPGRCLGEDAGPATAYTALRSMGKTLGSDALGRVVEVTGHGGTPQPAVWRIVVAEGSRGTNEVKVAGPRIVSQKVSEQVSPLKPVQLQDLNLDSSGAFDTANEQARKAKVPFTSLDYTLRVSEATGKPVWDIELHNDAGARVGEVRLAAHDGKLLAANGFNQPAPASTPRALVSADPDHDSVQATRVPPPHGATTTTTATTTYTTVRPPPPPPRNDAEQPAAEPAEEGGFFLRAGRTLDHTTDAVGDTMNRTGHAVDRTMRHTGEKLQRFFTGRGEPEPEAAPPAHGD